MLNWYQIELLLQALLVVVDVVIDHSTIVQQQSQCARTREVGIFGPLLHQHVVVRKMREKVRRLEPAGPAR